MERLILYDALLKQVRKTYENVPELRAFAPFPDDARPQTMEPALRPAAELFATERGLRPVLNSGLMAEIHAAAPQMRWRETYKEGQPDTAFMDRWGCFSIVGEGGPFASEASRIFVVYMPAGLYYPWHRHPAEELYLVLAGQALFCREGHSDSVMYPGQTVIHDSNQAHAIETLDHPVLCLVVWRSHLSTPPVLVTDAPR